MDNALRMHDYVDFVRLHLKQVHCLNDLQALVHQRRRVYRDFAAHAPGRVSERFFRSYVPEAFKRPAAERPAGRSEKNFSKRASVSRIVPVQTLKNCGMLTVYGQNPYAVRCGFPHDKLARRDERLFICKRNICSAADRRQRRPQSDHSNNRRYKKLGAASGHLQKALLTVKNLRLQLGSRPF